MNSWDLWCASDVEITPSRIMSGQNSALRYPIHPRLEAVHSQPRTGWAQPLHVSKKPGSIVEERGHCVPSISFVLGDFFQRKMMWRGELAWKQRTSAGSLFQYNLEKMTDLGWSCCQKRWLKRSKPEMEIRRMPEAWKKNKLSRYDWLDGFKINCTKDELG